MSLSSKIKCIVAKDLNSSYDLLNNFMLSSVMIKPKDLGP